MIFYREVSSSEIFYEVVSETYAFFLVTWRVKMILIYMEKGTGLVQKSIFSSDESNQIK
jgi:hypothetical protein